ATVSPPKPWERAGAAGANSGWLSSDISRHCFEMRDADGPRNSPALASSTGISTGNAVTNPASTTTSTATAGAPAVPERPSSLTSAVNRNASAYSPYGANRLGGMASPYGGIGSAYTSPYSRMGGMGGMGYGGGMYGGMGGMGGMGYGGYGGGMYGGMGGM